MAEEAKNADTAAPAKDLAVEKAAAVPAPEEEPKALLVVESKTPPRLTQIYIHEPCTLVVSSLVAFVLFPFREC
jgi:hypothetical protein